MDPLKKSRYLCESTDSTERLQKTPRIMANCNPVVPVMDWTEDAELHKRYTEWKEEVELVLGSSLSNRSNSYFCLVVGTLFVVVFFRIVVVVVALQMYGECCVRYSETIQGLTFYHSNI